MSDVFQGEGWWMASDGKWYAPQLHPDPDYRAKYAPASSPVPDDQGEVEGSADLEPVEEQLDESDAAPGVTPPDTVDSTIDTPEEPDHEDDTVAVIAGAGPHPEIRWPDLPPIEPSEGVGRAADELAGAAHQERPQPEGSAVESKDGETPDGGGAAATEDDGWVSHGPMKTGDRPSVSVARPDQIDDEARPNFEVERPRSVLGNSGSRARLEVGRVDDADRAPKRITESTVPLQPGRSAASVTTSTSGLTEIRVYKEPADLIDRIIAGVLFASGVMVIVGTFLTWVSEAGVGRSGWDRGDGLATVLAGVLGAAAAGPIFVGFRHIIPKTIAIVSGLVGVVVVGLVGLDTISDTSTSGTSLGVGFWLVLVGSLVMIGAGIAERTSVS